MAPSTPPDQPRTPAPREPRWTVIYDGDCGFCRTALALVLRADTARRLRPLALGTGESDRLLAELDPAARAASWHLVDPGGQRTSAGAAAPPLFRLLRYGAVPAALLAAVPGATERAYAFVAGHRSAISRCVPSSAKRRANALVARRTAEAAQATAEA